MKTSCISHPEREALIIIRKSQVEFCDGNQCAAAVLSFLEYWHNWKLDSDEHNKKSNIISGMHGDPKLLSEDVYHYHSLQEISDGIMNLYGTKTISEAIKLLESKKVISTHSNPDPRYHYDKTKHFRLYPDIYNQWLKARGTRCGKIAVSQQQKGSIDTAKLPDACGKNAVPYGKNAAHTEINHRDINQSISGARNFFATDKEESTADTENKETVQPVISALIEKGMPIERFGYPDVLDILRRLQSEGASVPIFTQAYDIAAHTAKGRGFGIRYLEKTVTGLLMAFKREKILSSEVQPKKKNDYDNKIYEEDLTNLYWMDDVTDERK